MCSYFKFLVKFSSLSFLFHSCWLDSITCDRGTVRAERLNPPPSVGVRALQRILWDSVRFLEKFNVRRTSPLKWKAWYKAKSSDIMSTKSSLRTRIHGNVMFYIAAQCLKEATRFDIVRTNKSATECEMYGKDVH